MNRDILIHINVYSLEINYNVTFLLIKLLFVTLLSVLTIYVWSLEIKIVSLHHDIK